MTAALATVPPVLGVCAMCREPFEMAHRRHRFCSPRCAYRWDYHHRDALDPSAVLLRREQNRRWCAEHRNVAKRNRWLAGTIPYAGHLPGGALSIDLVPRPRWPLVLRNVRLLHGLVSHALGEPHEPMVPQWSLIPVEHGCGWAVVFGRDDLARRLANREIPARIAEQPCLARFGLLTRIRAPRITRRGRQRLRIDAITPVCVRNCGRDDSYHTAPTADALLSTLSTWMPRRLGLALPKDLLRLELVESATTPEAVLLGGKFPRPVRGFVGHVIVDVNAPARWLLETAARGWGLGGRVAFGFGRVRVSEVER